MSVASESHPSRWNVPPPTYDAQSSYMSSTLTPYLQLPHLLSLTWLAYPILSLTFVAFRLQLSLSASQDAVANAKDNLLASCKAAERAAATAASMPRYLAIASNEQFADAVNGSLNAARATLVLSLTIMEAIINFIIDLYRSTFLCFLELVVRGGLAVLIAAVQELNNLIESVANGLRTSIQNDIGSANSAIKSAIDAINKINPFSDITAPQIAVPSLDGLQNISLPPSFQQALTNLNNSLPTVAELKDKIEDVIDTPFELLKKDINDTFGALSFNSSVLPVPQQSRLSFCNDMDLSVVDDVGRDFVKIAKIGTLILILLALLLIGLNCLLEWYKWRCMKAHLQYTREAWTSDPTITHSKSSAVPQVTLSDHNLMMLHANSAHPLLTRITNNLSRRLHLTPSQHTHLQWFFNYIFHPPALACLLIGLIGILSIQIQLAAMGPLVSKYEERSASTASDFSNTIATSINDTMFSQSAAYANDVNARVDAMQATINEGIFGWVNGTTVTLNTTIVNFYNDIQTAVSTVFDGTILETPAHEFIKCIIGTKVDAIENALTFLHDNLKIDMPRVNQTVLVMSPESVNEATSPIAAAAIGGGEGNQEGLIPRLVNSYADSLRKERVMFAIFIAIWGFVVLIALCVIFWHSYGKKWVELRKRRKWEKEQRSGINGIVIPFRTGMSSGDEKRNDTAEGLCSLTPMPSPKPSVFDRFAFARTVPPAPIQSETLPNVGTVENKGKKWGTFLSPQTMAASLPYKPTRRVGRKPVAKELLVSDHQEVGDDVSSFNSAAEPNRRNTAWFARMATKLGGKQPEAELPSPSELSFPRSQLQINVDRASSHVNSPNLVTENSALNSRWSASPDATQTSWSNILVPTQKTPPYPRVELPSRPKPRHTPSDVESTLGVSLMAPPLHHGFDASPSRQNTRNIPPPSIKYSQLYPSQRLAPPPPRHRRTSSVPWKVPDDNNSTSITPVTRLLTTTHARKSSSVDPFVTPFDDEHRVTIAHPHYMRKSIPTNPFNAIAL
ncbi:hypothetical protein BDZ94DRAFT_1311228 [Collybia nuda]|uniref:Plasma membrane fusion protein PRM1 n=1 Tax=Collybia nuda TaxID=64659 RepID=A0A9P5XZX2_9AGAR|nr:hypothetical protein BDZ94DRAFT_1311228 [Collybia nuda]